MNDEELDLLVASTSPISERRAGDLPLSGPEADLLEAIMSTDPATDVPTVELRRLHPGRWIVAVAAAVALVVGMATVQQLRGGGSPAWAAEIRAVAEAAPRLLVNRPGWTVTRADEFSVDQGEMTLSNGKQELDLHWIPIGEHDDKVADRASTSDLQATSEVAGHQASISRYAATSDYVALWTQGNRSAEARGLFASLDEFKGLLDDLAEVDVDAWLDAMPASVVKPGARADAVDEMLADIPLPDGFDRASLRKGAAVQDRYQLGAAVAGSVACGWIEDWIMATDAGDAPGAKRAVDAMATSHRWAILVEMRDEGAYPDVLWELADAMATDAPVPGGSLREAYADSLGCAAP